MGQKFAREGRLYGTTPANGQSDIEAQKALKTALLTQSITAVAKSLGVNKGTLSRMVRGKIPATNHVLHALGLPLRAVEVPPCPTCGEAHTVAWCTKTEGEPVKARAVRARARKVGAPPPADQLIANWSPKRLAWALLNREVMK